MKYILIMIARIRRAFKRADEGRTVNGSAEPTPLISNPPRYRVRQGGVGFILASLVIVSGCVPRQNALPRGAAPVETAPESAQQPAPVQQEKPSSASSLNLSGQGLTRLPAYVLDRRDLTQLDISNNALDGALPAEIRQLSKLRALDASDNQMTGVPAEIGQLSNLEVLDLSNNQLTGLPYELGNLQNLKTLHLAGNDVSQQDLAIIREKLPKTTQIYE